MVIKRDIAKEDREKFAALCPARTNEGDPRCLEGGLCSRPPGHEGLHAYWTWDWRSGGPVAQFPKQYWVRGD